MKNNNLLARKPAIAAAMAACALGWLCCNTANVCRAQSASGNLSPQVQEIVRLSRAHLGDDVIEAYIKNSGSSYNLSADDILYLNSQGVSQGVLSALLKASGPMANNPPPATQPAPGAPPPQYGATPPPGPGGMPGTTPAVMPGTTPGTGYAIPPGGAPPAMPYTPAAPPPSGSDVTLPYFQSQLAPYGSWVDIPPYGLCWRPAEAARVPDWRPYLNMGHWEYTEAGWTWQSDYPWGEVAFHYGRWTLEPAYGWVWVPGYNWGPAWVCWRHSEGYFGWAPLPPSARFEVGVGLTFGGRMVTDFDFGLPYAAFAFVPYDHFWAHDLGVFVAPGWRVPGLFRASVVLNGYHFVGGRFVIDAFGRDRIAGLTHHEVRVGRIAFRDTRIAHEAEFQRARAVEVQRGGGRANPGAVRGNEGRREDAGRGGERRQEDHR